MGQRTLGEVQDLSESLPEVHDRSGDLRGGPGRVEGPSVRSRTGQGSLWMVRDGLGTLEDFWVGSGDPRRSSEWVGRVLGSPGKGQRTLGEVQVRVGRPSGRSETGRGTLGEFRDRSVDNR